MNFRWLTTHVFLPFAVASVLSYVTHLRWPASGFWIGLCATFAGAALTITYVEWIVTRRDSLNWQGGTGLVRIRLFRAVNLTITNVRIAFDTNPKRVSNEAIQEASPRRYYAICKSEYEPVLRTALARMDRKGWDRLDDGLKESMAEFQSLLLIFGPKIGPRTFSAVLELQEAARSALELYVEFPEFFGSESDGALLGGDEASKYPLETTIRNVAAIVTSARELGESLVSDADRIP